MKKLLYLSLCGLLAGTQVASAQLTCNAQYTATAAPAASMPLRYSFNNTSTVTGSAAYAYTQPQYYYGDGSSSYAFSGNSYHNYAAPGTYNTMLVLRTTDSFTNAVLCQDTAFQTITVNYAPCAVSASSQANSNGSFTFTANNLGGTSGLTYSWNFGDGATSTGSPVTHTYAGGGTFQVILSSTGTGCSGGDTILVNNNSNVVNCSLLNADFTSTVNSANTTAYFTNTSSFVNFDTYNSADWYFGDGASQLGAGNTSHTYANAGTYTVTLFNHWKDSLTGQTLCTDSISKLVTITGSNQDFISGYIYWDTTGNTTFQDTIKVWLIQYDSVANTLTAVDSQYVSPVIQYYRFNNVPSGIYLTKAAFLGQTPGTTGYVPTYHVSSIYWSGAANIVYSGGAVYGKDILMQTGTVTSGPGFIGGNISMGAGKGTGAGIANMIVYLRNAENTLVASAYTNQDGDYAFSNIPAGTYNVYPESINYNTTPYNAIQVTTAQTNVTAIDFEQKNGMIYPKSGTTGISGVTKADGLNVYPNPSKDYVVIESKGNSFDKVQIVNTLGQTVRTVKLQSGINKVELSGVHAGVYYILISGQQGTRSMKLVKE